MSLAALTQRSAPLQLNLMAYRIQIRLTVMQAEVLVEALKHLPQVLLLIPAPPVHMLDQPVVGASEEFAAAPNTRKPDHGEASVAIDSTNV